MLCRLLPNIGWPDDRVGLLYAGVILSISLHGAPVSAEELMARKKNRANEVSVWRRMVIRFATGYRTLTHEAAAVLAGLPPLDLLVAAAARTYGLLRRCRVEKPCLGFEELDEIEEMKREIWRSAMKRRQGRLRRPEIARHRAVGPIATVLDDWMRGGSSRTFRLTQVLSGHGCFGEYLHKIGKEVTPGFWHCEAEVHSAQDILAECPAWAP